jgi:hypothetical protein
MSNYIWKTQTIRLKAVMELTDYEKHWLAACILTEKLCNVTHNPDFDITDTSRGALLEAIGILEKYAEKLEGERTTKYSKALTMIANIRKAFEKPIAPYSEQPKEYASYTFGYISGLEAAENILEHLQKEEAPE